MTLLFTMAGLILHDEPSLTSKIAVVGGNIYTLFAAVATDIPDWALVITPVSTSVWLLVRSYALIRKTNHEINSKNTDGVDESGNSQS